MATPNLALIPSAYKARQVYSVLPNNGVGDFTFVRSGNATRINKDGLIETVGNHVPRLNYDLYQGKPKQCPSLLLEPSRTNSIPYSEDFSNAAWLKSNSTITSNSIISPDGTLNADELQVTSSGGNIYDNIGGSGDGVFSVFAKYKDVQYIRLRSTGSYAFFDIKNGVLGSTINTIDTKIEKYPNGWYKCSVIGNNTNSLVQIFVSSDGANVGLGNVYLWGADFQNGSYPTSYIPTSGSTEIRNAEECNGAGNSGTFNDSEGVLFAEINALADDGTNRFISLTDGSNDNRVLFGYRAVSNQVFARIEGNNSASVDLTNVVNDTKIVIKLAIYYDSYFNYKMYLNGFLVDNAIGTDSIIGLDRFDFTNATGTENFYGKTKQIQYFGTALTDSQLEYLTSYRSFGDMVESQNYIIQ